MVAKSTTSSTASRSAKSVTAVGASGGSQLLLDQYPGAAAAYSLRKLRSGYGGSAIRVRRSSDSAEQDIGFTVGGDLDESALTTFCGAADGFVTTWYDQTTNGLNASQSTGLEQPKIVNAGVVRKVNGKPAVVNDTSVTVNLETSSSVNASLDKVFVAHVGRANGISHAGRIFTINDQITAACASAVPPPVITVFGDMVAATSLLEAGSQKTTSVVIDNTVANTKLYRNGMLVADETGAPVAASVSAGNIILFNRKSATQGLFQDFQEIAIYFSDQSANRSGIDQNINDYWSVY